MARPSLAAEMLKEDCFPELKWDTQTAARELDVTSDFLEGFLNGDNKITPEFANKLAQKVGSEADQWLIWGDVENRTGAPPHQGRSP